MRSTIKKTINRTVIACVKPVYKNGRIVAEELDDIVVNANIKNATRYAQRFYRSTQVIVKRVNVERVVYEMSNDDFIKHAKVIKREVANPQKE